MFEITYLQMILSIISGLIVGFSLGLIGGGGSILAIPLLIYFVGYDHPHIVIGTTALAVSINALLNLIPHARKKHVIFKKGIIFSIPGIFGVLVGAELGLLTPGKKLLFIFAILMIIIA
ncbi:MAG: sulfite exporter TauE/SafE family protein, partial [Thermoplasmata archaeon]